MAGTALGVVPSTEFQRRIQNFGGSEPNTLGAMNGVPSFFNKNRFTNSMKDIMYSRVPTELNRIDTIRNIGMAKGVNTNASPLTGIYKYQGYMDKEVARFRNASDRRNRKLQNRRQRQKHGENTSIIMDRPLG
tara:strand:+ start:5053 stop:5451 length:399 start_codon:yes stop_codon:yes gene_type:complete